jgi:hypothetical protein
MEADEFPALELSFQGQTDALLQKHALERQALRKRHEVELDNHLMKAQGAVVPSVQGDHALCHSVPCSLSKCFVRSLTIWVPSLMVLLRGGHRGRHVNSDGSWSAWNVLKKDLSRLALCGEAAELDNNGLLRLENVNELMSVSHVHEVCLLLHLSLSDSAVCPLSLSLPLSPSPSPSPLFHRALSLCSLTLLSHSALSLCSLIVLSHSALSLCSLTVLSLCSLTRALTDSLTLLHLSYCLPHCFAHCFSYSLTLSLSTSFSPAPPLPLSRLDSVLLGVPHGLSTGVPPLEGMRRS